MVPGEAKRSAFRRHCCGAVWAWQAVPSGRRGTAVWFSGRRLCMYTDFPARPCTGSGRTPEVSCAHCTRPGQTRRHSLSDQNPSPETRGCSRTQIAPSGKRRGSALTASSSPIIQNGRRTDGCRRTSQSSPSFKQYPVNGSGRPCTGLGVLQALQPSPFAAEALGATRPAMSHSRCCPSETTRANALANAGSRSASRRQRNISAVSFRCVKVA